jgi:hypothetical protein
MHAVQRIVAALVAVAWALWLGGLGALFLAVTSVFHTLAPGGRSDPGRTEAGRVAAGIFHAFERYQLVLAAAGLVLTFGWRVLGRAPRLKTAFFGVLALAAALAVTSTLYITPQIDDLRKQGTTTGRQFEQLHGLSMVLYTSEAAVLLIGGFVLPSAMLRDRREQRAGDADGLRVVRADADDHGVAA